MKRRLFGIIVALLVLSGIWLAPGISQAQAIATVDYESREFQKELFNQRM
ncbi:hypothetical protein DYZ47_02995 [Listeria monocytogenes]|nr:hypothetical protein [Listeria monocytogenes]RJZ11004.1 hypothetical protein DYZ47_02995 [Listeria monocytogenes]